MERYTIEVDDAALASLREVAEARGISIEEAIGGLVETTYAPNATDDWVHELIAMTRPGVDFTLPDRLPWERPLPFADHDPD
ncbi:MAG: hypothetical protein PGN09_08840 [Sphingomonas fennica]